MRSLGFVLAVCIGLVGVCGATARADDDDRDDDKPSAAKRDGDKPERGPRGRGDRGRGDRARAEHFREMMLERFDKDGDGELSEEERDAARKAFEARRREHQAKGGDRGKGDRAKGERAHGDKRGKEGDDKKKADTSSHGKGDKQHAHHGRDRGRDGAHHRHAHHSRAHHGHDGREHGHHGSHHARHCPGKKGHHGHDAHHGGHGGRDVAHRGDPHHRGPHHDGPPRHVMASRHGGPGGPPHMGFGRGPQGFHGFAHRGPHAARGGRPSPEAMREAMLKRWDKDGDGKLSEAERDAAHKFMMAAWRGHMGRRPGEGEKGARDRGPGDRGAGAHGRRGGPSHFGPPHARGGPGGAEAARAAFMKRFDKDGDGQLSDDEKQEIRKSFESHRRSRGGDRDDDDRKDRDDDDRKDRKDRDDDD